MKVGYARVSTTEQSLDLQQDALSKAGCERIFSDIASGGKAERSGLGEALEFLREKDTLVVWRLDRMARSLKDLITIVTDLQERKVGVHSLQENIDTTSSSGKLVFHIFGALAEFEREIIRERTKAGLAAARARGRTGGRKRVMEEKKIAMAMALYRDRKTSVREICQTLQVSKSTFYRYLKTSKREGKQP